MHPSNWPVVRQCREFLFHGGENKPNNPRSSTLSAIQSKSTSQKILHRPRHGDNPEISQPKLGKFGARKNKFGDVTKGKMAITADLFLIRYTPRRDDMCSAKHMCKEVMSSKCMYIQTKRRGLTCSACLQRVIRFAQNWSTSYGTMTGRNFSR